MTYAEKIQTIQALIGIMTKSRPAPRPREIDLLIERANKIVRELERAKATSQTVEFRSEW